jgi:hypothetical protein
MYSHEHGSSRARKIIVGFFSQKTAEKDYFEIFGNFLEKRFY